MYNNITLVVQGKPNLTGINNAALYSSFAPVVYSLWEEEGIPVKKIENPPLIRVLTNKLPQLQLNTYNIYNLYYQVCSTLLGLAEVSTEFVIKFRCDERYTNLIPLIDSVINNPGKITSGNILFRPDNWNKFHASDHYFGGRAEIIKKGLIIAKEKCERLRSLPKINIDKKDTHEGSPEQVIHMSILEAMGIEPNPEKSFEIMRDNYLLVNCKDLGDYIVRSNMHQRTSTPQEPFIDDCIRSIPSMYYLDKGREKDF